MEEGSGYVFMYKNDLTDASLGGVLIDIGKKLPPYQLVGQGQGAIYLSQAGRRMLIANGYEPCDKTCIDRGTLWPKFAATRRVAVGIAGQQRLTLRELSAQYWL